VTTTAITPSLERRRDLTRFGPVAVAGVIAAVAIATRRVGGFPDNWNINLADPIDDFHHWVQENESTHWLFTYFFTPISDFIDWALNSLAEQLEALPWYALPLLVLVLVGRTRRWVTAAVAAVAIALPGLFGLWEPTMETLSLMLVSVALAVVLGVPLGVAAGLDRRFYSILRPVLDAMQTVPSTAYLVPSVLMFGIGQVPAAVATVIYALPPVVRLTALGVRRVPAETVEAAHMFGSTQRQVLLKVQLPQAVPSIMTGVNQTINMALGIIVIAALVGAGGLGQEALQTLQLRSPGRGLVVGLAIVALAVMLDRVSRSFIERATPVRQGARASREDGSRAPVLVGAGAVIGAIVLGRQLDWTAFPADWGVTWADWVNDAVQWIRDHWRAQTKWLNEFLVRDVYVRISSWLKQSIAWPVLIGTAALAGLAVRGWRLALFCGASVTCIGLVGLWDESLETLVQVLMAVVLAMLVAVPIGVFAGRRPRFEQAIGPVLDAFQTIPPLIYAIPFVTIFDVGIVPGGIIASVVYAIPPGIRVTALGVRSVPEATIEAATTFGASKRQLLWGVRLPLALPAIMLAVNQVILMVVAMVIIAGLTGGGALGYRIVETFTRTEIGRGVEVALALTLMAMILDRLSQALAERLQPPSERT
jgi:glycine betaine/proline transport system permease protein